MDIISKLQVLPSKTQTFKYAQTKHELSELLPQNFFSHNVFKWVMVLVQIITDQTNSKLAPPPAHK